MAGSAPQPPLQEAWAALEGSVSECEKGLGILQMQILEGSPSAKKLALEEVHAVDQENPVRAMLKQIAEVRNEVSEIKTALEAGLAAEVAKREAVEQTFWTALQQHRTRASESTPPEETSTVHYPGVNPGAARSLSSEQLIERFTESQQANWQTSLLAVQDRLRQEISSKVAQCRAAASEDIERRCNDLKIDFERFSDQKADSTVVQDMVAEHKLDTVGLEGRLLEEKAVRERQYCALIEAVEAMRSFMQDTLEGRGKKHLEGMMQTSEDEVASFCRAVQETCSMERRARESEVASVRQALQGMQGSLAWVCQEVRQACEAREAFTGINLASTTLASASANLQAGDVVQAMQQSLQTFETKLQEKQTAWAKAVHRQCKETVDTALEELSSTQALPSNEGAQSPTSSDSPAPVHLSSKTLDQMEGLMTREREVRQAQHDALQIQVQEVLTAQRAMMAQSSENSGYTAFTERIDEMDRKLEAAILAYEEALNNKTTRLWEAVRSHLQGPQGALQGAGMHFHQTPQRSARQTKQYSARQTPAPTGCTNSLTSAPSVPSPVLSPPVPTGGRGGHNSPIVPSVPLVATLQSHGLASGRPHSAASSVRRQVSSPGILSHATPRTPSTSRLQSVAPAVGLHSGLVVLPRASSVPQRRPQATQVPTTSSLSSTSPHLRIPVVSLPGTSSAPTPPIWQDSYGVCLVEPLSVPVA